jgi:hypothetical protein
MSRKTTEKLGVGSLNVSADARHDSSSAAFDVTTVSTEAAIPGKLKNPAASWE